VYAWIWRHLPFGRAGKIIGSLLLVGLTSALLWYVVFPWAEPLLPFDDVQVTQDSGQDTTTDEEPTDGPSPDGNDLPYPTDQNNPPPSR
jgi:hypothetical protein